VPFSIYFILLRGWYALEDTKTPFYLSLVLNTINVVLSIVLFELAPTTLKVPAIGLATGLTYWLMMPIAWPVLRRRTGGLHTRATWLAVLRMIIAGAATTAVTLGAFVALDIWFEGSWDSRLVLLVVMVLASVAGLVTYLAAAQVLRIKEVGAALAMVRAKVGR
jgi:putative peptidoglycan lipid II flippase